MFRSTQIFLDPVDADAIKGDPVIDRQKWSN